MTLARRSPLGQKDDIAVIVRLDEVLVGGRDSVRR
jgi:hypothetical protein